MYERHTKDNHIQALSWAYNMREIIQILNKVAFQIQMERTTPLFETGQK